MNAHQLLEKFLSASPRFRAAIWAAGVILLVGVPVAAYILGRSAGLERAEDRYIREREKNLAKISDLESEIAIRDSNEQKLAAENAILRKRNEATAEILRRNDAAIAGDAKKLSDLQEKRDEKLREIDLDTDFDVQLRGLCDDLRGAGFGTLSVCRRFEGPPQDRR